MTGYRVHALDGEIGHIENLMIHDADWSVHYLIVDTRNWWFGKHVLISPIAVKSVDWFDRHLELDVSGSKSGQVHLGIPSTLLVGSTLNWPAAGSVDTEIGCFREPEASDAEAQVQSRVQDRGGPLGG